MHTETHLEVFLKALLSDGRPVESANEDACVVNQAMQWLPPLFPLVSEGTHRHERAQVQMHHLYRDEINSFKRKSGKEDVLKL